MILCFLLVALIYFGAFEFFDEPALFPSFSMVLAAYLRNGDF
jgi:hypothetical protein